MDRFPTLTQMLNVPVQGVDIASGKTEDTTCSVQAALAMVKFGLWQPSGGFLVEVKSPGNRSKPLHRNRSWLPTHPLNVYAAPGRVILIDTNLWLYAALSELPQHQRSRQWLESSINGDEPNALPWSVVQGVLRINTQARLLRQLIDAVGRAGNLTPDAHLGAPAISSDSVLCSADNDFRRFPGRRFLNPLI